MKSTNNLTPHPHANTIKEWALHLCSGAVDAGWYALEEHLFSGTVDAGWYALGERSYKGWDYANNPAWFSGDQYRITMTDKHPNYKPPEKMIKVEFEISEVLAFSAIKSASPNPFGFATQSCIIRGIAQALENSK